MRHWQPVRAIYKIASSTARKLVSRGRPNALRAGMEGSITAHSASVRSLAYRCPARSYFGRVISVHMLYLDDCSTQPLCYNHLKSLNSFPVSLLETLCDIRERNASYFVIVSEGFFFNNSESSVTLDQNAT